MIRREGESPAELSFKKGADEWLQEDKLLETDNHTIEAAIDRHMFMGIPYQSRKFCQRENQPHSRSVQSGQADRCAETENVQ